MVGCPPVGQKEPMDVGGTKGRDIKIKENLEQILKNKLSARSATRMIGVDVRGLDLLRTDFKRS